MKHQVSVIYRPAGTETRSFDNHEAAQKFRWWLDRHLTEWLVERGIDALDPIIDFPRVSGCGECARLVEQEQAEIEAARGRGR